MLRLNCQLIDMKVGREVPVTKNRSGKTSRSAPWGMTGDEIGHGSPPSVSSSTPGGAREGESPLTCSHRRRMRRHGGRRDALLLAWGRGDRRAGAALIERHYDGIERFFLSKAGDRQSDLTQQTFLRCAEAAASYRGESSRGRSSSASRATCCSSTFAGGLATATSPDFNTSSVVDLMPGAATLLGQNAEQRQLILALQRLPLEFQIIVELFYWEDFSVDELAACVKVPAGTIRAGSTGSARCCESRWKGCRPRTGPTGRARCSKSGCSACASRSRATRRAELSGARVRASERRGGGGPGSRFSQGVRERRGPAFDGRHGLREGLCGAHLVAERVAELDPSQHHQLVELDDEVPGCGARAECARWRASSARPCATRLRHSVAAAARSLQRTAEPWRTARARRSPRARRPPSAPRWRRGDWRRSGKKPTELAGLSITASSAAMAFRGGAVSTSIFPRTYSAHETR